MTVLLILAGLILLAGITSTAINLRYLHSKSYKTIQRIKKFL